MSLFEFVSIMFGIATIKTLADADVGLRFWPRLGAINISLPRDGFGPVAQLVRAHA